MGLSDDIPDIKFPGTLNERKEEWLPKNQAFVLDFYKNGRYTPLNDHPSNQLFNSLPDGKTFDEICSGNSMKAKFQHLPAKSNPFSLGLFICEP